MHRSTLFLAIGFVLPTLGAILFLTAYPPLNLMGVLLVFGGLVAVVIGKVLEASRFERRVEPLPHPERTPENLPLPRRTPDLKLLLTALKAPPRKFRPKYVRAFEEQLSSQATSPLWGPAFERMAMHLNKVLVLFESDARPLLASETLNINFHFNRRLRWIVQSLKERLASDDEAGSNTLVEVLEETTKRWAGLIADWVELRRIAASTIAPRSETRGEEYRELRHVVGNVFQDPETGEQFVWNASGIFLRPDLVEKFVHWIKSEIEMQDEPWEFHAICSMSSTGMPIAILLYQEKWEQRKELLVADNETYNFLPRHPKPDERILLVDSGIQTGGHLDEVTARIKQMGAEVEGAVFFALNDLLPEDKKERRSLTIASWIKERKLVYLYKFSDLYEVWKTSY